MQYPYNNKNWKFLHKQSRLKQFNRILAYLSDSYQFIENGKAECLLWFVNQELNL